MKVQLLNAFVFDPKSRFFKKKVNVLVENGVITKVGNSKFDIKEIDLKGAYLTPGFVDMCANFNDPGLENKEDIHSGVSCALHGGFTDVCLQPNTNPPITTKGDVEYLIAKSGKVDLWPLGAVSEDTKGENLAELLDLAESGAVAFTDGVHPISNGELLLKAFQYLKKRDGLLINRPKDKSLSRHAQMHEGQMSTSLGMVGEPSLSEEISIIRDLEILKYTGGRIHFSQISSARSVELIKKARKDGLNVTCDVNVHHLYLTDEALVEFDTNYKLDPPFRTEKDRKALIKGLMDGVIDAIVSGHQPQDSESKDLEFDLAESGVLGLQQMLPILCMISDELPLEVAIEKVTSGPRSILRFEEVTIAEGAQAKLTWFDPNQSWTLNSKSNQSKSVNTPFFNSELKGKVLGVLNKNHLTLV